MKLIRIAGNRDRIVLKRYRISKYTYTQYFKLFWLVVFLFGIVLPTNYQTNTKPSKPMNTKAQTKHIDKQQAFVPQAYAEVLPTATPVPQNAYDIVKSVFINRFGADQWQYADQLINNESSWNQYVYNPSSSACGLFQSLPCTKVLSYAGSLDNAQGQAQWGADYIAGTYGTPAQALYMWNSRSPHWY